MLENADTEKMRSTTLAGYRLFSIEVEYGGVKQRWVVVILEESVYERAENAGEEDKEGERTGE